MNRSNLHSRTSHVECLPGTFAIHFIQSVNAPVLSNCRSFWFYTTNWNEFLLWYLHVRRSWRTQHCKFKTIRKITQLWANGWWANGWWAMVCKWQRWKLKINRDMYHTISKRFMIYHSVWFIKSPTFLNYYWAITDTRGIMLLLTILYIHQNILCDHTNKNIIKYTSINQINI